jgi:hypothetical protein
MDIPEVETRKRTYELYVWMVIRMDWGKHEMHPGRYTALGINCKSMAVPISMPIEPPWINQPQDVHTVRRNGLKPLIGISPKSEGLFYLRGKTPHKNTEPEHEPQSDRGVGSGQPKSRALLP